MRKADEMLQTIEGIGALHPGTRYLIKHLNGERLSRAQGMAAKCADCMGFYADGRGDCEIPECPMYAYMPYREVKEKIVGAKVLSEDHKAKMMAGKLAKVASLDAK